MNKAIEEIEFTIFDTETTGLEPCTGDRVVEIAAIRFRGQERISSFETLINPQRAISEAAFQVNRITEAMLKNAPLAQETVPRFLRFIEGSCLCSYNAGFDIEFLNNELSLIGKDNLSGFLAVDILRMAKRLLPGLERYALWFVAEKLGIETQQKHRALADVELTLSVFYKLEEILRAKGILGFDNFLSLFAINRDFLKNIVDQRVACIQEAINLGSRIKIKYLSSSGAAISEREVIPKEIKQENSRSYLVGHCCLRNQERTFRIDGILHLEFV